MNANISEFVICIEAILYLLKYTFHIAHLSEEQCNRERDYKAEIFKYFHITYSIKFVDKATITCKF